MVQRKPGQRLWVYPRCQCGGRWIIPKRNGAFRAGGSKSNAGRTPIRVYGPVIKKHVPFRGGGGFPSYSWKNRMREFQICSICGEKNIEIQAEWRRKMGYDPTPEPEPGYDPPKRTRDFSRDAEKRKAKARLHKARQWRR